MRDDSVQSDEPVHLAQCYNPTISLSTSPSSSPVQLNPPLSAELDDPTHPGVGWALFDAGNTGHYPLVFLNEQDQPEVAKYICFRTVDEETHLVGTWGKGEAEYATPLYAKAYPSPNFNRCGVKDTDLNIFHPAHTSRLLVDTALVALRDPGVLADVHRFRAYHNTLTSVKRQRLELDKQEDRAEAKLLTVECRLASSTIRTRLQQHLLVTRPPSPPTATLLPPRHQHIPRIFAAQGPPDVEPGCYNPPYFLPGPSPDPVTLSLPADKPPLLKNQSPIIFPSAMPPNLMSKRPLPMNPPLVEDLPPCADTPHPMSTEPLPEPLPEPLILEPPVEPLIPIPWNIHRRQYSSMEEFVEHVMQNPVSWPVDNLDSPMADVPPLEPDPVTPYLLDSPEGHTHTLSPDKSPTEPWQQWLDSPDSPISHKHSLSPSSPSSAPIRQRTSREGSYHSIMPQTSSPAASTEASSEGNQLASSSGSLDSTPSTQTPTAVDNNELSLDWVTLPHAYRKG